MRAWLVLLLLGLVALAASSPQRSNRNRARRDEDFDPEEREDDNEDNGDGSRRDRRNRDDEGNRRERRPGGDLRRGGPGGRDKEEREDGDGDECREAKLDSKRANCRKAVVIVDEATECADATGPIEFLSPQEMCQDNAGQNVYMCKVKGRREVMDLVESFLQDKLGEDAGRREIRDELCNESADFSDLDLSSLQIEEDTSKRCITCA